MPTWAFQFDRPTLALVDTKVTNQRTIYDKNQIDFYLFMNWKYRAHA